MSAIADIIVENARLAGRAGALANIAISDGVILEVGQCQGISARLTVDAKGNLVVLDYPDVTEALRRRGPPRLVISHGRVVDAEREQAMLLLVVKSHAADPEIDDFMTVP